MRTLERTHWLTYKSRSRDPHVKCLDLTLFDDSAFSVDGDDMKSDTQNTYQFHETFQSSSKRPGCYTVSVHEFPTLNDL